MSSSARTISNSAMVYGVLLVGICVAIVARAQYNTFDSDSNSDSDGNPILTQAELGKLVRNSAKAQSQHNRHNQQQLSEATRNLYNRQQPLQYAPSYNKRNYGSDGMNGFGPVASSASGGRGSNSEANDDDDGSSSLGPDFDANIDSNNNNDGDNEGRDVNGDGPSMNLNQAASGYPGHGDYSGNDGNGFGYGPSSALDSSDFGPSEGFGGDGRRAKSASSPLSSRNFGSDDDAGAPQFGPNSAVNSERDADDEGRAGYAPEGQNDNDNDDE